MKIVVAFGGNALADKSTEYSIKNQLKTAQKAVGGIVNLLRKNHKIVITHGNGMQVGDLLLQSPSTPLEVCVAESQGLIGYILEQTFLNEFYNKKMPENVAVVLTHVVVDEKDPAFKKPTKPIGPFYSKAKAKRLQKKGIKMFNDSGRGFRCIVASPAPLKIVELDSISNLFEKGTIAVACGGGGIPIVKKNGKLKGVAAVIDKDLASALLAKGLRADLMMFLTEVDFVFLNFGKKDAKPIFKMSVSDAKKFLKQGHFGEGSMKPKILAAIKFIEGGGKKAIICSIKNTVKAFSGKTGTQIVP